MTTLDVHNFTSADNEHPSGDRHTSEISYKNPHERFQALVISSLNLPIFPTGPSIIIQPSKSDSLTIFSESGLLGGLSLQTRSLTTGGNFLNISQARDNEALFKQKLTHPLEIHMPKFMPLFLNGLEGGRANILSIHNVDIRMLTPDTRTNVFDSGNIKAIINNGELIIGDSYRLDLAINNNGIITVVTNMIRDAMSLDITARDKGKFEYRSGKIVNCPITAAAFDQATIEFNGTFVWRGAHISNDNGNVKIPYSNNNGPRTYNVVDYEGLGLNDSI